MEEETSYNPLHDITNNANESNVLLSGKKNSLEWDDMDEDKTTAEENTIGRATAESEGSIIDSSSHSGASSGGNEEPDAEAQAAVGTVEQVKKRLFNEEEFRSINQAEPIHIFLKLKPLDDSEMKKQNFQKFYKLKSDTGISLIPPKNSIYSGKQSVQNIMNTTYYFSYIFQPEITQKDFFTATIYPCMQKFFNGDNLLIFSYGVTNSGKTYTMQGTDRDPGLIPRTVDLLFESIGDNLEKKREIYQYKPDKFNEIACLSNSELNIELNNKEILIRSSHYKEIERFESCDTLNMIGLGNGSLEASKTKFGGSLDTLSSMLSETSKLGGLTTDQSTNQITIASNIKYSIWLSFYELYNDSVYDLLTLPTSKSTAAAYRMATSSNVINDSRPPLKIREDSNRVPYVEGLTQVPIFNTLEAIKILKYGEKNLQKSSNSINQSSSRSHAIFNLKLVAIEKNSIGSSASISQLIFCDLAGIERTSKTQAVGKTQKEASVINNSLLNLSRCIETMMQNQKNKTQMQIPYRSNKLTRLFQPYFEGRGMVKMVVNLNPSVSFFDENVNVLKFASIANQIQIAYNDEDKIHYKIDNSDSNSNDNRLTLAWENDTNRSRVNKTTNETNIEDEDEEEEEEEEEDEEDEEDEEETEEEEEETEEEEEEGEGEEEEDELMDDETVEYDEDDETEEEETEEEETDEEDQAGKVDVKQNANNTKKETNEPAVKKVATAVAQEAPKQTDETMEEEEEDDEEDEEEDEEDEEEEDEEEEEEEDEDATMEEEDATTQEPTELEDDEEEDEEEEEEEEDDEEETEMEESALLTENDMTTTSVKSAATAASTKKPRHSKSAVKKTPFTEKKLKKKKLFECGRLSDAFEAMNDPEAFTNMTSNELIALINRLKLEFERFKVESVQFESDLRNELVSKWSKRVEEAEAYHQNELVEQKNRLDTAYTERIKLMETLLERKMQSKIDELTKKSRSELDEAMKRHEREKQELAESYEQAKEGYMQAQKKAKDELIQEYKKSLDDLQSQDEELTRARESESKLKKRVDELTGELEESKRRGNDSLDEIVKKMDEMKSKHAAEVKSLNVELIYAQEGLKSSQFDHNQLKMSLDEVSAKFEESQTKCEELKRTVADLERKLAEAEKMAAIAAAAKEEEENKAQMECDMEWEDEAAADKKSLHDQEQQTIYCEMTESAVQTSFELAPRSREHASQTDKVAHKTIASGSNDPMPSEEKRKSETEIPTSKASVAPSSSKVSTTSLARPKKLSSGTEADDTEETKHDKASSKSSKPPMTAKPPVTTATTTTVEKKKTTTRVSSRSKLRETIEEPSEAAATLPEVTKKPVSRSRLTAKTSTASAKQEQEATDEGEDMVEEQPPIVKPVNLIKKKSTLGRLTDLIAKSPILEPLRGRPKRQAASKLKASSSNASEFAPTNLSSALASVSSTLPPAEPTVTKKLTRKQSTASISAPQEPEPTEVEAESDEDVKAKKPRKKRTVKK